MSTHTSGPWRWFDYQDGRKLLAAPLRAVVHCPDGPMICAPADQQLIAAAPDLLEACRALDQFQARYESLTMQPGCMPGNNHYSELAMSVVRAARAAIAKAEGRS